MDKLRSIQAFITAVESGSFTAAARSLDITPVMVGKHVRTLEQSLNQQLLQRNTRRQQITEAGQIYYQQCRKALEQLSIAEARLESLQRFPSGSLRISAPRTLGNTLLASLICGYQAQWPDVRVELELDDRHVDLLAEQYDFAIRVGRLPADSPWVAHSPGNYQMVICASPAYLAQAGTPQTPGELSRHRCMGNTIWNQRNAWQLGEGWLWPGNVTFSCNDGQALRMAALAGAGIILQPHALVAQDLRSGHLVPLLKAWWPAPRPIWLLWAQDIHPSAKGRSFIDWIKQHAPAHLPQAD